MLLHIFELDDQEHDHGPLTPEAKAAVEASDAHIGQVLAALEAAGTRASTLVAIVSDHGFLPVERTVRPTRRCATRACWRSTRRARSRAGGRRSTRAAAARRCTSRRTRRPTRSSV
jgi:arylsulfatase A-like enzyme